MWLPCLLPLLLMSSCHSDSLSFKVHGGKEECFYKDKEKGDKLDVNFYVTQGSEIAFSVIDKNDREIVRHNAKSHSFHAILNDTGPIRICFDGVGTLSEPVVVLMDVDVDEVVADASSLDDDKKKFLDKALSGERVKKLNLAGKKVNLREKFLTDIVKNHHVQSSANKSLDETLQKSLIYLSILADRMSNFMKKHNIEMRRHSSLQQASNIYVTVFSFVIAVTMVIAACAQVAFVKSLFNGHVSYKFWQF